MKMRIDNSSKQTAYFFVSGLLLETMDLGIYLY